MKKVKILYISYDSILEPIPQSQVIPYLIELSKDNYCFRWLSFDKPQSAVSKEEKESLIQYLQKNDIFWHSLIYYKRPYLIAKLFNIFCGIVVSSFYVLKEDISIIHCRSEVAAVIGLVVKFIFRKKLIYDRRGFMAEDYVAGGMWGSKKGFLYKLLIFIDSKLLFHADGIVVLTHKMKDWLISNRPWVKDKIAVIPCCVDLSRFDFHGNGLTKAELGIGDKFLFVYSGSIGSWHGLDEMVDLFITAKRFIPEAHFLILTMEDYRLAKDVIRRKGAKPDDFTVKNTSFDEVPKFLKCADSSICFVKGWLTKLANSPTKFAEFLSSGLPVIMNSGVGDSEEIVRKERVGVIIKDFTPKDYEQCIDDLLRLIRDKEALKNRCIEAAKKYFSLGDGVSKYKKIYQSLS